MDCLLPLTFFAVIGVPILSALLRSVPAPDRRAITRIIFLAFGLRLAACTLFALVPETRIFHDDAVGYERIGMRIAAGWRGDGPPFSLAPGVSQSTGYFY